MGKREADLEILLARERAHKTLQMLGVSDCLFQQPASWEACRHTIYQLVRGSCHLSQRLVCSLFDLLQTALSVRDGHWSG